MCIIVVKGEKIALTKDKLHKMWSRNPDGAGIMYAHKGKVHVSKGFMSFKAFWKGYQAIGPMRKMAIHFRIKTHGAVSQELTHPFWIERDKVAMMHNGIIGKLVPMTSDQESDSLILARNLAKIWENPVEAMKEKFNHELLKEFIGYSKLVFMNGAGEIAIVNEQMGEWHDGCWYSNSSHRDRPSYSSYTGWMDEKKIKIQSPM